MTDLDLRKIMDCNHKPREKEVAIIIGICPMCLGITVKQLRKALEEIREGRGAYDQDPLKHCANTVEDMKLIADKALKDST